MNSEVTSTSMAAALAVLELTAVARPDLIEFQVQALWTGSMAFTVHEWAGIFGIPADRMGEVVTKACRDLDRLEVRQRVWSNPAHTLQSPNLGALVHLCDARLRRVEAGARRARLEVILRKLERAYERARRRAWIDDFLGPPLSERLEVESADR